MAHIEIILSYRKRADEDIKAAEELIEEAKDFVRAVSSL